MKRYNRIMEVFWLAAATLTLVVALQAIAVKGIKDSYLMLSFPVISLALYAMRRYFRKKVEKAEKGK